MNLIQRIMKNVTTPVLIEHNRETSRVQNPSENLPHYQQVLIMRFIDKACHNFRSSLDDLKSQGKSASEAEEFMMSYFKYPNATYLTHTLFQQI
jgi:hypothetical protein